MIWGSPGWLSESGIWPEGVAREPVNSCFFLSEVRELGPLHWKQEGPQGQRLECSPQTSFGRTEPSCFWTVLPLWWARWKQDLPRPGAQQWPFLHGGGEQQLGSKSPPLLSPDRPSTFSFSARLGGALAVSRLLFLPFLTT